MVSDCYWTMRLIVLVLCVCASFAHQQQQPPLGQQQPIQQHHQQPPPQQQHQQQQQQQPPQQHQQQQQHQQPPPPPPGVQSPSQRQFGQQDQVHDTDHIKTHLDGQVDADPKQMSNEQLQFHYFTMHDLDKNNMLDGIELIKAITHFHAEDGVDDNKFPVMTDSELEDMIDSIMKDDDFNNDGFIDYGEFLKAQGDRT